MVIKKYNIKIILTIVLALNTLMNSSVLNADCSQLELIYDYPYMDKTTPMSIDYQKCDYPHDMRSKYRPHSKDPGLVPGGIETGSRVCIGDADWSRCAEGDGDFKMPPGNHRIICGSSGSQGPVGRWMKCKLH